MKEDLHEGENKVDEVVGKVINRRESYNIDFRIGVIISHKEIKQDQDSKCLNLTYS